MTRFTTSILMLGAAESVAAAAGSGDCNEYNDLTFLMINGDANLQAVEDEIVADLAKVGLNVKTELVSKKTFNSRSLSGDFHLAFSETWGAPYDPHAFAMGWVAGDEGHQFAMTNIKPSRQELFDKVDAVLIEEDEQKRADQWESIHQNVHDNVVSFPLWGKRVPTVMNSRLSGYKMGSQQFDYPVHALSVTGSKTVTIAPGAQNGLFESVGPMNPHGYRPSEFFSNNWIYEGLVGYSNKGQLIPALATDWEIDDNDIGGSKYHFTLRENVKFHDGAPWNCDAAVLNFDNFMAKPLRGPAYHGWFGLPKYIENWSCEEGKLVINTNAKYYPFLQDLSYIRPVRMLSPNAFNSSGLSCPPGDSTDAFTCVGITNVSGTGPFQFVSRETSGGVDSEVIFQRNPNYWGGVPDIETLKIVKYDSADDVLAALKDESLDVVWGSGVLSGTQIADIQADDTLLDVFYTNDVQNELLLINSGKAPLDDINLRKTIAYAINKVEIGKLERGAISVDNQFPLDAPYCNVTLLPRFDYDIEMAQQLNCPEEPDVAKGNLVVPSAIGLTALFLPLLLLV